MDLVGGQNYTYTEVWPFLPDEIGEEGVYTAGARFTPSGQDVTQEFEVKFAHR